MASAFITLDPLTIVTPLGLSFHDTASGGLVGDGLSIWAHPSGKPTSKRRAFANRRGVYVLHHAPGLRDLERGDGSRFYWDNLPFKKDFVIEVNDDERRFQPFQFTVSLPVEGIFRWSSLEASPPTSTSTVPLYSSPVRAVPPGMAVIRADLWDTSTDGPAAWAVIEAHHDNKLCGRGMADETGRIALIFPYPAPISFAPSSPPGSPIGAPPAASGPPLTEQVWRVGLKALYTPLRPLLSPPQSIATKQTLPDLQFTLAQPEATIWADAEQSETLEETNLRFGRELTLKSRSLLASPPGKRRDSVLFITPAISPP